MSDREKKPRQRMNVFTRHPDGAQILQDILDKKITQTKAAKLLGCSIPNVSSYLKSRKLRLTKVEKTPPRTPSYTEMARGKLVELEKLTLIVDGMTPNETITAVGWKAIQQALLILADPIRLEPDQFVKVTNQLIKMWEFQIKNEVPEIPPEVVHLDPKQEQEIVDRIMEKHDEWCNYKKRFDRAKNSFQNKHRLEPRQSPPVV